MKDSPTQPGRRSAARRGGGQRLLAAIDTHRQLAAPRGGGDPLPLRDLHRWLGRLALEARESGPERLQNVARLFEILRGASGVLRDARLPFLVARLDVLIQAGDDPHRGRRARRRRGRPRPDLPQGQGPRVPDRVHGRHGARSVPDARRRERVDLPVELIRDGTVDGEFHLAEERRLCYVGMTRSREASS